MNLQFGNRQLPVETIVRLTALAGAIGEDEGHPDTLWLRFDHQQYSRAEVLELMQLVASARPDECEMDGNELRLWWD